MKNIFFAFSVGYTLGLYRRAAACCRRRDIKILFFFSRFSLTKSAAKVSKEDSRRPPSEPPRRARVSRASHAWRVRAARGKGKIGSFTAPHDFSHTTRANISHEKAEQIRARIVCTPAYIGLAGVGGACAPTGQSDYLY